MTDDLERLRRKLAWLELHPPEPSGEAKDDPRAAQQPGTATKGAHVNRRAHNEGRITRSESLRAKESPI